MKTMINNKEHETLKTIEILCNEDHYMITPYLVSRKMGYNLSGRISHHLKSLEKAAMITRKYHSGNICEIGLPQPPTQEDKG